MKYWRIMTINGGMAWRIWRRNGGNGWRTAETRHGAPMAWRSNNQCGNNQWYQRKYQLSINVKAVMYSMASMAASGVMANGVCGAGGASA